MPKPVKYSYVQKNDLPAKNIVEHMSSAPVFKNTDFFTSTDTTNLACPVNSYLDTVNESPNPQQKPCHCVGTEKWIPIDGSC